MTKSPHNILVGQGAQDFAKQEGFEIENNSHLLTEDGVSAWKVSHLKSYYLTILCLCFNLIIY